MTDVQGSARTGIVGRIMERTTTRKGAMPFLGGTLY
jgi:hypothetical protein